MKTILVDAIDGLILKDGTLFQEMYQLLETYPHRKIALTGANDAQFKQFNLQLCPYELFTLKHNPEAVASAQSLGIPTMFYDAGKRGLGELKVFLDSHLY